MGLRSLTAKEGGILEGLKVYNTLARDKEPFKAKKDGKVSMYTCGPTVYDFAHIGNFRAFLTYDLIKRWLTYCGYDVDHICNLTDVDDKIIQRMQRDGVGLKDLTEKFANAFLNDIAKLNIIPANKYPRATEHIEDMVQMIQGNNINKKKNISRGLTRFYACDVQLSCIFMSCHEPSTLGFLMISRRWCNAWLVSRKTGVAPHICKKNCCECGHV
jgi:hypothetical protein